MNKYINNLQGVRSSSQKIHLNTVKKVVELTSEVKKLVEEVKTRINEVNQYGGHSERFSMDYKELEAELHELEQDVNNMLEDWGGVSDKFRDAFRSLKAADGDLYNKSGQLEAASMKLEEGAEMLGIPVPPEAKKGMDLATSANKLSNQVDDLHTAYDDSLI